MTMESVSLARRLFAEAIGTAILVATGDKMKQIVVGQQAELAEQFRPLRPNAQNGGEQRWFGSGVRHDQGKLGKFWDKIKPLPHYVFLP